MIPGSHSHGVDAPGSTVSPPKVRSRLTQGSAWRRIENRYELAFVPVLTTRKKPPVCPPWAPRADPVLVRCDFARRAFSPAGRPNVAPTRRVDAIAAEAKSHRYRCGTLLIGSLPCIQVSADAAIMFDHASHTEPRGQDGPLTAERRTSPMNELPASWFTPQLTVALESPASCDLILPSPQT
jgi:hypothetical protein